MHVALEKMDIGDMQPKLALTLQSVLVPLLLLPVKWTWALFLRRLCTTEMVLLCTASLPFSGRLVDSTIDRI